MSSTNDFDTTVMIAGRGSHVEIRIVTPGNSIGALLDKKHLTIFILKAREILQSMDMENDG